MNINYVWRKDKADSKGIAPIYLITFLNGERVKVSTGEKSPEKFSSNTNIILGVISKRLNKLEEDCKMSEKPLTKEMIVAAVKGGSVQSRSFFTYWQMWMEESKYRVSDVTGKAISPSTIKRYAVTRKILEDFQLSMKYLITIQTMNNDFYSKFRTFIIGKKKQSINTFSDHIKNVKVFCRWLQKVEPGLSNDFRDFKKSFQYSEAEPLKPEELLSLYNKEMIGHKEKARLIFLVLCCTGMRISDYQSFSENEIIGEMIIHTSKKTNHKFYVPYFDDLYFRPVYLIGRMKELFGCIPKISDQKLNDYIAIVAAEAGINRIVPTTKTGRKTFATLKLLQGIAPEVIMKSTGHKTRSAFDAYVGIDTADILKAYKDKAVNFKVG